MHVLAPGPHPSWLDPSLRGVDGCSHGVPWSGTCLSCRTDSSQGCYHRPDLAVACQACRGASPPRRGLLLRLFDAFCDRFVLTGPR